VERTINRVYAPPVRLRFLTLAVLVVGVCAAVAVAAGTHQLHAISTFRLAAGKTRQFSVAYPDALEYGGAKYSGSVTVLAPSASEHGSKPSLHKVHIRSRGSALGDSQYAATVHNFNALGTASVRVKLTATTTLPAGTGG
jgi:hypothetical protein